MGSGSAVEKCLWTGKKGRGGEGGFGTATNLFAAGNWFSYHICHRRNLATGSI